MSWNEECAWRGWGRSVSPVVSDILEKLHIYETAELSILNQNAKKTKGLYEDVLHPFLLPHSKMHWIVGVICSLNKHLLSTITHQPLQKNKNMKIMKGLRNHFVFVYFEILCYGRHAHTYIQSHTLKLITFLEVTQKGHFRPTVVFFSFLSWATEK